MGEVLRLLGGLWVEIRDSEIQIIKYCIEKISKLK